MIFKNKKRQKLQDYAQLLMQWNQIHNLSGVKNLQEIEENIADCLYPLSFIAPFKIAIDIGSGCGFPAIPLAITSPQSFFYLTEPRKKRASFLRALIIELGLDNIKVSPTLLQDSKIPQKADLITSRAVASTPLLLKISIPFIAHDGAFLFYKGSNLCNEGETIKSNEIFTSPTQRVYFYRKVNNV